MSTGEGRTASMSIKTRLAALDDRYRPDTRTRVEVELLTDEDLAEMSRKSGYNLRRLSDEELNALRDCCTDAGDYLPERMTPELATALEMVKL